MPEMLPSTPRNPRTPQTWKTNPPPPLQWKQTSNTFALSRWEAGDYRLDGAGHEYGGGVRRDWKLFHSGRMIGEPSRLSEGKRDAETHHALNQATPDPAPAASVDDSPPLARTPAEIHTINKTRAVAALARNPIPLSECTHGGDCLVHPDRLGIHDFTPSAVDALQAVLVQVRYLPVTETTLREIVRSLGLDWADVERGL